MATKGVNKVILVGNVGGDPESRSFPDGSSVTNISIATSESWKDKQTGQTQERTEWHRVVLRDRGAFKLGQIAAQYLKKGSKVYIEGSLKTRKYQAQDGSDRYVTEIIANEMQMLDGKQDSVSDNAQSNTQAKQSIVGNNQAPASDGGFPDFDDRIPF